MKKMTTKLEEIMTLGDGLMMSLHTKDPGDALDGEAIYPRYGRVAITAESLMRLWDTGTLRVEFPRCVGWHGAPIMVSHFAISNPGRSVHFTLKFSISVSDGVSPIVVMQTDKLTTGIRHSVPTGDQPHDFYAGKFRFGEHGMAIPEEECAVCGKDPRNSIHASRMPSEPPTPSEEPSLTDVLAEVAYKTATIGTLDDALVNLIVAIETTLYKHVNVRVEVPWLDGKLAFGKQGNGWKLLYVRGDEDIPLRSTTREMRILAVTGGVVETLVRSIGGQMDAMIKQREAALEKLTKLLAVLGES